MSTNVLDKSVSFTPHQHNIIYAKWNVSGKMLWKATSFSFVKSILPLKFFKKFLPLEHHLFDEVFRNTMEKGKWGLLKVIIRCS